MELTWLFDLSPLAVSGPGSLNTLNLSYGKGREREKEKKKEHRIHTAVHIAAKSQMSAHVSTRRGSKEVEHWTGIIQVVFCISMDLRQKKKNDQTSHYCYKFKSFHLPAANTTLTSCQFFFFFLNLSLIYLWVCMCVCTRVNSQCECVIGRMDVDKHRRMSCQNRQLVKTTH